MRIIIQVIGLLVFFLEANGEVLRFEHYSDENGLSHNSVRSIIQDTKGYIWLGTFGGVNRFNGYSFKAYTGKPNDVSYLQDNDITQLVLGDDEHMWIGTSNGLTRYHIPTSSFNTFHPDSMGCELVGNKIRSLFIDSEKRVWVGTKDNGLCYYSHRKKIFVSVEMGAVKYVRSIFQTQDKTIWVGTFGYGLYAIRMDGEDRIQNTTHYDLKGIPGSELNPDVFFIYQDHKFDLFVGTRYGLFKKNKFTDAFDLVEQKNVTPDFFRCITQGPNGKYWVGTLNGLLVCDLLEDISIDKYERYVNDLADPGSLGNNYVTSLFFDKSGVLWIGTENGLDKYDPFRNQFKTIRGQSLAKDVALDVSSYGKTIDGHLLLGTHSNGLYLLKNNSFRQISSKEHRIASIYSADGKVFYCGLWDGRILKYNYLSAYIEIIDVGINDSPVFSILQVAPSLLLIGSHNEGLHQYDLRSRMHKKIKADIQNLTGINKIIQDDANMIWFATQNGVFKYDRYKEEVKNYIHSAHDSISLSNIEVKDILIDADGKIWAGTRQGLNYYDATLDNFVPVHTPPELKDIWITDMAIDSLGKMWLNINYNQIANYNPRNNELRFYIVKSGMRSTIYYKRGFLYFDHSRIYLGGENGIIYFAPTGMYENIYSPKPVIDKLVVHNKEVFCGDEINGQVILNKNFNYVPKVELNYVNRDFSVSFSSSSYVNQRLNQYKYVLNGYTEEWTTVGSDQRNVQFTNLKPGKYKLRLKARNNDGYWSDESMYEIIIMPPFWYTYKAFAIYIILFLLLIFQIRRITIFRIKMKQELLFEKIKREKDEKLNEEKLRFFTNISHELKTPLTLILGPAKQLLEFNHVSQEVRKNHQLIYSNAARLLGLVNQIIDFRKVERGEVELKVSHIEIVHYTQELFASFQIMADQKQLAYSFDCKQEKIEGWIDVNKYERIIFNLLSNAFKFTLNGQVKLSLDIVEKGKRCIQIAVQDTGIGIPKNRQGKIFNRFYQVKEQLKYNTGSGIGLSFVKSLVEIHHGEISFESEINKGSTFYILLPIGKTSYASNELFECNIITPSVKTSIEEPDAVRVESFANKEPLLIIEDNEELRKYIANTLSDTYKTYESSNGEEGLELVRKIRPVMVVSDVMMERMDGFEFCRQLKKDQEISHIPVILLTALAEIENKKEGLKIGADAYISKPFDPSLLKVQIINIIENRRKLKERYSSEADMEFDQLSHSQADDEFINKIQVFIQENMMSPKLNKELLCSEFGISSSKLYRKIKELTDLSPNEMIRTVRLKNAFVLLKNGNNNVSEVAYKVGFSDPFYFSRCFSKQFGHPPSKLLG